MFKRMIAIAVSAVMMLTMTPAAVLAETNEHTEKPEEIVLEDGTFAPGEVVVLFKAGAVKDNKLSLSKATELKNVDEGFGETMESAGEENEAADDAKSEIKILKKSLGDDFELLDSIAFSDDLIMSLVRSEKYKTEVLIEKLKTNDDVESVEPNWYTEDRAAYSLNDEYAKYVYHVNSAKDENTGGDSISPRGVDKEKTISTSAGSVTDFKNVSSENEIVIAVNDSGINYDHEDLKDVLWTNPGNIGLDGEHGFNFEDNMTEVKDTFGHGTHVSGIIAAKANNGKGVAGVASGTNVKIMALSTNSSQEEPPEGGTFYRRSGALYYALRAKQRGVNVVAVNNSWGSPGPSYAFDKIFEEMGEAGILNFFSDSNDALDIDKMNYDPPASGSPYTVVVGSANIDGVPSGFTDYGKSNVDLFAPGHSILSTVSYSSYFPNLYTAEERAANTEYYGQFSSETKVGEEVDPELNMKSIVPDTHGDGVKPFGAAKFFVQDSDFQPDEDEDDPEGGDEGSEGGEGSDEGGEGGQNDKEPELPAATCDVSIVEDKYFTDNYGAGSTARPATLKVTVNNAKVGERYFIYFPFMKNHETTGYENTRYSMTLVAQSKEDEFCAEMETGEIIKHKNDGKMYCEQVSGSNIESDPMYDNEVYHQRGEKNSDNTETVLSWDDVDPEKTDIVETGLGVSFTVYKGNDIRTPEEEEFVKGAHPVTFYVDSVAVSRPVTEEGKTADDVFSPDESYDLMSGTSMATPAATGAYAVLCALEPKKEGQTDRQYLLQNRARFFSLVTRRDELKDLCSTGGYIDLSNINDNSVRSSISNAVCDVDKKTVKLYGTGLTKSLKLYKKSLAGDVLGETDKDAEEVLIEENRISFADDGKSLTISDAEDLIGTYTEFILKDADAIKATGSFFLVRGQKEPEQVLAEEHKETADDSDLQPKYLFTDKKGTLYAYDICSYSSFTDTAGTLYKYDGNKFIEYQGTKLYDSMFDYFENERGLNRHEITRGLEVTPKIVRQPIIRDGILYTFVDTTYTPRADAEEEDIKSESFLAAMDFTADKPAWKFSAINTLADVQEEMSGVNEDHITYGTLNDKIYAFVASSDAGDPGDSGDSGDSGKNLIRKFTYVFAFDLEKGKWERLSDFSGASLFGASTFEKDGKLYVMLGSDGDTVINRYVYTFDGKTWEKDGYIPFIGKKSTENLPNNAAVAPVRDGFVIFNYSAEGYGNTYLYNTSTHSIKALYYTFSSGLSDAVYNESSESAVEAADGLYFIRLAEDNGVIKRLDLYRIPKSSRVYRPTYKDANPMTVSGSSKTLKASKVRKKSVKLSGVKVKNAKGKVTYKKTKIKCSKKLAKSARKKIKVNSRTGKITLKKGLKKGKYTVYVQVKASGDDYYKSAVKTAKYVIKIKG